MTTPIATRLICRMREVMSPCHIWPLARRSIKGITIELHTMIDRATVSTITMAVAADRPPINASMASNGCPSATGKASTNVSPSTACPLNVSSPAMAIGMTKILIITR